LLTLPSFFPVTSAGGTISVLDTSSQSSELITNELKITPFIANFLKGDLPLSTETPYFFHDSADHFRRSHDESLSFFYPIQNTLDKVSIIKSVPQGLVDQKLISQEDFDEVMASVNAVLKVAYNSKTLDSSMRIKDLVDLNSAINAHINLLKRLIPKENYNLDDLIKKNLWIYNIAYYKPSNFFSSVDFLADIIKTTKQNAIAEKLRDWLAERVNSFDPDIFHKLT